MGGFLSREAILAATDLPTEEVAVPEWLDAATGADRVLVRGLNAREAVEYQQSVQMLAGGALVPYLDNSAAKLVARCVIGEDGKPLFTQDDVTALGEKSAKALGRVFDAAARLSGLAGESEAEAEGNSGAIPANGSASSSPANSAE